MRGYTIKKVYVIICDRCNEDITRPQGDEEPETRAEAERCVQDHEATWHPAPEGVAEG